jgi:hypothetical protein
MNIPSHDRLAILLLRHCDCVVCVVVMARERGAGLARSMREGRCSWFRVRRARSGADNWWFRARRFEAIVCLNKRNQSPDYATGGSKWLVGPRTAANEGSAARQGRPVKGSTRAESDKGGEVRLCGVDSDGVVRAMERRGRR